MSLLDAGPAGFPSFPEHPDPELDDRVLRTAHRTGRCPVLIRPVDPEHALTPVSDPAEIDALDGREVLARWWPGPCLPECPCGGPLPAGTPSHGPEADLTVRPETFDSADTPAVLGWAGACHHGQDRAAMAAVLRHRESRRGAVVAHPPTHDDESTQVAGEPYRVLPGPTGPAERRPVPAAALHRDDPRGARVVVPAGLT